MDTNGRNKREDYYSVRAILDSTTLLLSNNLKVRLIGVKRKAATERKAIEYLNNITKAKKVFMKFDDVKYDDNKNLLCYLYLENKTCINSHLVKTQLVDVDELNEYRYRNRFVKYSKEGVLR